MTELATAMELPREKSSLRWKPFRIPSPSLNPSWAREGTPSA